MREDRVGGLGHRGFEDPESHEEGWQVAPRRRRIGFGLREDPRSGGGILFHRGRELRRHRLDVGRSAIRRVGRDALAQRRHMLVEVGLDVLALESALRLLRLKDREDIGADGIVHHIRQLMVGEQHRRFILSGEGVRLQPHGADPRAAAHRHQPQQGGA